jgi:hypothetical protein
MKNSLAKLYNWWLVIAIVAIFGVLYLSILYPWLNHWGLTDSEANISLPGDHAMNGWVITSTRGVTIHAPASEVWKWVVQLGQERAGFYSHDWLENLVLSDIHNGDEIRAEWQQRQAGDQVFGAGGAVYGQSAFWPIRVYEAGKVIYLWGPIVVLPLDAQTSQLITRTYAAPASPVAQMVSAFTYDWIHDVMERGMLLGIKARSEQTLGSDALIRGIASLGWIFCTLGVGLILFARRRNGGWGLLSLAYAAAIIFFTRDLWAAMAGFLWFGIITAGFLVWGRRWWKGLILSIVAVITIFVLSDQPHTVFGIVFLVLSLGVSMLYFQSNDL